MCERLNLINVTIFHLSREMLPQPQKTNKETAMFNK